MSLFISGITIILSEIWASLFGMGIYAMNPNLEREMAAGWFLTQIPVWFLAIYAGLIVSAIMSTVASGIQSVTVNAVNDVYKKLINPEATEKDLKSNQDHIYCCMCISCSYCFSISPRAGYYCCYVCFFRSRPDVSIFAGFYYGINALITANAVIVSMFVGFGACFISMMMETVIPYAIFGLVGSGLALIVATFIFKPKQPVSGEA